jgi:uncharacterized protein (DUF1778 family)
MSSDIAAADVHIHLRARDADRALIDRAAGLAGTNRSQFMLASAIKEAKTVLADQTTVELDHARFHEVMSWLDGAPSKAEEAGLERLRAIKPGWTGG